MLDREDARAAAKRLTPSDEEVVERVLAGETELFELLMRRHNQRVYRAVRSVLRVDAEAEDVMQQAWLQAFAHLGTFTRKSQVSTWLVRIAMNEALMRTRKRARLTLVPNVPEWMESDMAANTNASPEDQAQTRELSGLLEAAVDRLPETYRTVFVLREVEGLSTADAAQALDVTEDVVKTRLHRARNLLKDALFSHVSAGAEGAFLFLAPRCDRIVHAVMSAIRAGR